MNIEATFVELDHGLGECDLELAQFLRPKLAKLRIAVRSLLTDHATLQTRHRELEIALREQEISHRSKISAVIETMKLGDNGRRGKAKKRTKPARG